MTWQTTDMLRPRVANHLGRQYLLRDRFLFTPLQGGARRLLSRRQLHKLALQTRRRLAAKQDSFDDEDLFMDDQLAEDDKFMYMVGPLSCNSRAHLWVATVACVEATVATHRGLEIPYRSRAAV